jgi:hypothetical protein
MPDTHLLVTRSREEEAEVDQKGVPSGDALEDDYIPEEFVGADDGDGVGLEFDEDGGSGDQAFTMDDD